MGRRRLGPRDRGQTTIEYALLVALIAVVLIVGTTVLGNVVSDTISSVGHSVHGSSSGGFLTMQPLPTPTATPTPSPTP